MQKIESSKVSKIQKWYKMFKTILKAFYSPKRRKRGPVNTSSAHVKSQKNLKPQIHYNLEVFGTLEQVFDRGREIN